MTVRLRAFELRRVATALLAVASAMSLVAGSCSPPPPPPPPRVSYEQKVAWILWLEDQRVLRDPAPAPVPPPAPVAKGRRRVVVPSVPDAVPDLPKLLADADPRVRRRAALAIGRVGLPEGVDALLPLVGDTDPAVQEAAAFALGLLGDARAAAALVPLMATPGAPTFHALVGGRAAEAIGLISERVTPESFNREGVSASVGGMVAALAGTEAVRGVAPDEMRYPLAPEADAFRLGLYALVRLKAYDQVARAVLDQQGQPKLRWWPVAYALQRLEDPRAVPALLSLLGADGAYAAAFAARGLGKMKDARAVDPLVIAATKDPRPAVRLRAVEALGSLGDARGVAPLVALLDQPTASLDPGLRLEVVTALGKLHAASANDRLLDLLSDPWPSMRVASARALALIDPVSFVTVLSGMDLDPEWSVRAGLVETLASLEWPTTVPRLVASLDDPDQRAIPAVLRALVRAKAPGVDKVLIERLRNEEPVVRAAAARLLGEVKPAGAAAVLVAAYQAALNDPSPDVREDILEALVSLGASEGREIAARALKDRDWGTRLKASAALKKLDPSASEGPERPAPVRLDRAAYDALAVPTVSPHAFIDTTRGTIEIELAVVDAPLTTRHFITLVKQGFYNGLLIHRVVGDFVVQVGDPRGDGTGGPGFSIRDELNDLPYLRGTVGMALAGPDTGGSQFFLTRSPQPHLDAKYTVFARVVSGLDVIDRLQQWDSIERIRVWDGATMAPK